MHQASPNPYYPGPEEPVPAPVHPKPVAAPPAPLTEDQKVARVQRALAHYRHNMKHNAPRTPTEYKELEDLLMGEKKAKP